MSELYRLEGLAYRYGPCPVLQGLTTGIQRGALTGIVGPNGAGKSTLMSVLAGLREDYGGSCTLSGVELRRWPKRRLARLVAFIPQAIRLSFPFTAEEVVFMGRTPHCHGLFETAVDRAAVQSALKLTDAQAFASRRFTQLSGGEQQRVILASALAQEPEVLLLDEPTTFLDIKHQTEIYALLRRLADEGKAVVAVTHDLNLAAAYSDRMMVVARGGIAADGSPIEVLNADTVRAVFETEVQIQQGPSGRPWMTYA